MKRVPVIATLTGLLLALLPLSAVRAEPEPPGAAPTYGEYVALGDSYTAGPLIPEIRNDPLGCVRSTHNYPARLAAFLDVDRYADVSCSGARAKHLRTPQPTESGTNAPQLDALGPDTDLVTLGIGGNDFGLFGSLIERCTALAQRNPRGAPCRRWFNRTGVDVKKRDARRIGVRVERGIRRIHRRAPHARIVVVGYLRIVPVGERYCRKRVPFAKGDYAWANGVEHTLNMAIRDAARSRGATFVGMYPASRGHTACAPGSRAWVNGQHTDLLRAAAYHPFARGMRGIARQAYRRITGDEPSPTTVPPYRGRTLAPRDLDTYPHLMRALTTDRAHDPGRP